MREKEIVFSRCLEYKKPTHTFGLCESWVGFPRRLLWKCGFLRGCVFVRGGKVKFLLQRDQIAARQKWSFPVSSSVSVCDWRFEGKKEWQKRGNHSKNDRSIFTAPSEDRSRAGKLDKLDYEFSYLETTTTISIISSDHWSSVCERSRRKRRRRGKTHRDRDQWSSATTSSISNGCVLRICVCAYVGVERMCDDDDALWAVDSIHKWVVECEWRRKKKKKNLWGTKRKLSRHHHSSARSSGNEKRRSSDGDDGNGVLTTTTTTGLS